MNHSSLIRSIRSANPLTGPLIPPIPISGVSLRRLVLAGATVPFRRGRMADVPQGIADGKPVIGLVISRGYDAKYASAAMP